MKLGIYKKIISVSFIVVIFAISFAYTVIVNADNHINPRFLEEPQEEQILKPIKQEKPPGFVPLAPIPNLIEEGNTDPVRFFNNLFQYGITIAGFLAVIMIALGGLQYMSTDAISGKKEGREKITYALMGLLLVLFSYILLNTINPDILNFDLFKS